MKLFLGGFLVIAVSTVDIEASIFTEVKHKKDGAMVQGIPGFESVAPISTASPKVFIEGNAVDREKFCKAFYCDDIKVEKAGTKPSQPKKK